MKTNRTKIQWVMIYIVFFAILLWGGREIGPDLYRRWDTCRWKATYHAKMTAFSPDRQTVAYHKKLSAKYRHALYVPWEFWSLGDYAVPIIGNP